MELWIFLYTFPVVVLLCGFVEGQLYMGPCGKPKYKHLTDIDLAKYAGVWHIAATTEVLNDEFCSTMHYKANDEKSRLEFISGSQTGSLEKEGTAYPGELKQRLDNFPRSYHLYILSTDYDNLAVEYTCLDGVFAKSEHVRVLTRQKSEGNEINTIESFNLAEIIPDKLMAKLQPVEQKNC